MIANVAIDRQSSRTGQHCQCPLLRIAAGCPRGVQDPAGTQLGRHAIQTLGHCFPGRAFWESVAQRNSAVQAARFITNAPLERF